MADLLKIKLDTPPRFNGTTEFETFAKRLTNYMSISNSFYGFCMKEAAVKTTPVTEAQVRTISDPQDSTNDMWKFAKIGRAHV